MKPSGVFTLRGMRPVNMQKTEEAMKGHAYTSPDTYKEFLVSNQQQEPIYILVNNYVFTLA
jgi:hypothetical protein